MKIAFATIGNQTIDEHFGQCLSFAIYDVKPEGFDFLEMRSVNESDDAVELHRIDSRIDMVQDCTILYCTAIGPTAAARVVRRRIHPIKSPEGTSIQETLTSLTNVLKNPPIWLRKVLEKENASKV